MNDKLFETYQKASGSVMVPADVYAEIIASRASYEAALRYMQKIGQKLVDNDKSYLHEAVDVINVALMLAGMDQIIMRKEKEE